VFAGKTRIGAEKAEKNGGIFLFLFIFIYFLLLLFFFFLFFFPIYAREVMSYYKESFQVRYVIKDGREG